MATLLDSKHIIWQKLYDTYEKLNKQFPGKIDVKVIKSYPKTFEDVDKNSAIITVSRVAAPEEYRFVGDLTTTELDNQAQQLYKQKGNLQTEHLEIAVWSLNAEYRDDIYILTRQILFEEKEDFFRNYSFIKFVRLSGADQEIDVGQLPRVVYRGVHIYMATHLLQFQKAEDLVGALNCSVEIVTQI